MKPARRPLGLLSAAVIGALTLTGCGGDSVAVRPFATPVPTAQAGTLTFGSTPALVTLPVASNGITGNFTAVVPAAGSATATGAVTLTATPPGGLPTIQSATRAPQSGRGTRDGAVNGLVYATFTAPAIGGSAAPYTVTFSAFALTLPAGTVPANAVLGLGLYDQSNPAAGHNGYDLTLWQPGTFDGTTVRFGPGSVRVSPGVTYAVALYVVGSSASPAPTATPTAAPTAAPTATPTATPTTTPTAAPTTTPTATPTAAPTATPPANSNCGTTTTTGSSASTTCTLSQSGGVLPIPVFAGFGGSLPYPVIVGSQSESTRLTTSTSDVSGYAGTPFGYPGAPAGKTLDVYVKADPSGASFVQSAGPMTATASGPFVDGRVYTINTYFGIGSAFGLARTETSTAHGGTVSFTSPFAASLPGSAAALLVFAH